MNVKFNRKSRMMEIEFQFRDVKDPNLFRNIFPYNEVQGWFSTTGPFP